MLGGRAIFLSCCVGALILSGCGPDRPPMGKVRGQVTYDDVPVSEGTIQFWPTEGRPSRGTISEDGTFELTTFDPNDGAYVGQHVVTIKATKLRDPQPELESTASEIAHFSQKGVKPIRPSRVDWLVPREYSDVESSTLTAVVELGENEINFQLTKDGKK